MSDTALQEDLAMIKFKHNWTHKIRLNFYSVVVQMFKIEEINSRIKMRGSFSIYFVIIGLSIIPDDVFLKVLTPGRASISSMLYIPLLILHLIMILCFSIALRKHHKIETAPSLLIRAFSHLKLLHLYLSSPLYFWFFPRTLVAYLTNQATTASTEEIGIGIFLFFTTLVFNLIFLYFVKNHLPSASCLTSPQPVIELLCHCGWSAVQFASACSGLAASTDFVRLSLEIGMVIFCLLFLALLSSTPVLWDISSASFYLSCSARCFVAKIFGIFRLSGRTDNDITYIVLFLIFQDFAARACSQIFFRMIVLRLKRKDIEAMYFSVFQFELINRRISENETLVSKSEKEVYFRLLNLKRVWDKDKSNSNKFWSESLDSKASENKNQVSETNLREYLIQLIELKNNTKPVLVKIIQLQLILVTTNLTLISGYIDKLRRVMNEESHYSFEYYYLKALVYGRMRLIYTGILLNQHCSMKTFSEILFDLTTNPSTTAAEALTSGSLQPQVLTKFSFSPEATTTLASDSTASSHLDIEVVFTFKDDYQHFCNQVERFLDLKHALFSYLLERPKIMASYLFNQNKELYLLTKKIDAQLSVLTSSLRTPPYIYSAAAVYFLKVKFSVREADAMFKRYRGQLQRLQHSNKNIRNISVSNMMQSSVVMRVGISSRSSGKILDITPGWAEYLGRGEAIGRDINDLFPGFMQSTHRELMKHMSSLRIFNSQREFYIKSFDGYLQSIVFYLKLGASIEGEFYSTCLLRFCDPDKRHLVLLDKDMNILSASKGFWKVLNKIGLKERPSNMRDIADSVCVNINIATFAERNMTGDELRNHQLCLRWKDALTKAYMDFKNQGIVHKLNVNLLKNGREIDVPITVFFERQFFGGIPLYKLRVTFDIQLYGKFRAVIKELIPKSMTKSSAAISSENDPNNLDDEDFLNIEEREDVRSDKNSVQRSSAGPAMDNQNALEQFYQNEGETVPFEVILKRVQEVCNFGLIVSEIANNLNKIPDYFQESVAWIGSYIGEIQKAGSMTPRRRDLLFPIKEGSEWADFVNPTSAEDQICLPLPSHLPQRNQSHATPPLKSFSPNNPQRVYKTTNTVKFKESAEEVPNISSPPTQPRALRPTDTYKNTDPNSIRSQISEEDKSAEGGGELQTPSVLPSVQGKKPSAIFAAARKLKRKDTKHFNTQEIAAEKGQVGSAVDLKPRPLVTNSLMNIAPKSVQNVETSIRMHPVVQKRMSVYRSNEKSSPSKAAQKRRKHIISEQEVFFSSNAFNIDNLIRHISVVYN
jgi:hypothetical protein